MWEFKFPLASVLADRAREQSLSGTPRESGHPVVWASAVIAGHGRLWCRN